MKDNENELIVKLVDRNFEVKGTFDFGYIGTYSDSKIEIFGNIDEVKDWDVIQATFKDKNPSDEMIANFLTEYLNSFQKKIKENQKLVNNTFLSNIFYDMYNCSNPFWKIKGLATKSSFDTTTAYEPLDGIIDEIMNANSLPNDGSVEKPDVEALIRKNFPLFNMDFFLKNIKAEGMCLGDGNITFQCSDTLGFNILCSGYDQLDESLTFTDWHNF